MTKEELATIRENTKEMSEFLIKIDRGFGAPVVNAGVCMTVTVGGKEKHDYLFINARNLGNFLPYEKLMSIKAALEKNDGAALKKECDGDGKTILCIQLPSFITRARLMGKCGSALMGVAIHSTYQKISNRVFQIDGMFNVRPFADIDYRNFAARVSLYMTNAPAGLGVCTTIEVVPTNKPHAGGSPDPKDKYVLVGFTAEPKGLIISHVSDLNTQFAVDLNDYALVDDTIATRAEFIEATVDAAAAAEALEKRAIDAEGSLKSLEEKANQLVEKVKADNTKAHECIADVTKVRDMCAKKLASLGYVLVEHKIIPANKVNKPAPVKKASSKKK